MAGKLEDARRVMKSACDNLLAKENVVAVGVGYKTTAGKQTDQLAIVCSVSTKQAKARMNEENLIPQIIDGIATDVVPTGVIRALQDPTQRYRPAPGGVSIGHFNITAGTLGCLVEKNGKQYILSNNHVLANSNDAQPGDAILQPGPYDGGQTGSDQIAVLSEFVPITFQGEGGADPCGLAGAVSGVLNAAAAMVGSRTRLYQKRIGEIQQVDNLVDAAIAEPVNPADVSNEILQIGQISGIAEAALGMSLQKFGRTTSYTTDTVQQIDVVVNVNYGSNKIARFVDQIIAGPMSQGGDSGSAVLNDSKQLVGLLYAGSQTNTIINRIQNVFSALQVTLPS